MTASTRNLTDDTARLATIQTRLLVMDGRAKRLRLVAGLTHGQLGKAAGVAGDVVDAWERGVAEPTAGQALAWLDALTRAVPRQPAMGIHREGEAYAPAWSAAR
jgi:transcriptional regulator with XRE-family HTH domain